MTRPWRLVALAVLLPLAGLLLMVAAVAIPDRWVMDGLFDAIESGTLTEESYGRGYTGSLTDGFSECKRLTVGLGSASGNPLATAVESPMLGECERAVPAIRAWAEGEGLVEGPLYFRYWNGSAVAFRPLVASIGLDAARIVAALGVAAAAAFFWRQLARHVGRVAATAALVPLVLTTDFIDLAGALLHALGMVVALSAAALLLRYLRGSPLDYAAGGFVAGAAFLYFGDMTNPDAAWTLTAASAAVVAVGSLPVRRAVASTGAATAAWIIGFGWMWASKWLIAIPVLGWSTVRSNVGNQIEFRLAGETPDGFSGSLFGSIERAWDAWLDQPLTAIVALGAIVAVVVLVRRPGFEFGSWQRRLLIASPAVIPIVWHLALRNHVHFHAWFTYRSFAVAFGVVLLAATARLGVVDDSRDDDRADTGAGIGEDGVDQAQYGSTASGSMS